MDGVTQDQGRRALAEVVRRACLSAAAEAYERAREDGLCADGAWEAAMAAVQALDLGALAARKPAPAKMDENWGG